MRYKVFLGLILVLLTQKSFAATSQVNSIVSVGGGPVSNLSAGNLPLNSIDTSNLSMICGGMASSGAGQFFGLFSQSSPTTSAQYSVPAGQKFYAINMWTYSSSSGAALQLGYGTAAIASEGTGTPPTGVVYYGATAAAADTGFVQPATLAYQTFAAAGISFPANSFPFFRTGTSSAIYNVCIQGIVK